MSATAINDMSAKALNHVELVYAARRTGPGPCPVRDARLRGPRLRGAVPERRRSSPTPPISPTTRCTRRRSPTSSGRSSRCCRPRSPTVRLRDASAEYLAHLQSHPQRSCHFGIRYPSVEALDAALERIEHVSETNPDLEGRVSVSGVFRPGDPGSYTDTMVQAFVRTDVIASGLLTFGQHVELQWQVPE